MKVAAVTVYPPRVDGIADYATRMVAALRRTDAGRTTVDVYSLAADGVSEDGQRAFLSLDPRSWVRLHRELRDGAYDVVHLQFDLSTYLLLVGPLFVILGLLRLGRGPVVAATFHEASSDRELYGAVGVAFYTVFSVAFDRIYVHSRPAERCLVERYRVAPTKVRRISHGTYEFADRDLRHDELRRRWGLDDAPVVLSFGYIYRTKGIDVLIDAIRLLADGGRHVQVVVAGETPRRRGVFRVLQARNRAYLTELSSQVRADGLDGVVHFVGRIAPEDLHSLFTLAQVVVLPYRVVDQSGVLNIAVAAGTPVVASDIGGLAEMLADVGVLVPASSSAAVAGALDRLLSSPAERERLTAAYGAMADRLRTGRIAEELLDDYRLAVRRRPRIVQVSAYYPPHVGGQERVVEQLSHALALAGAGVSVITSDLPPSTPGADRHHVRRLWAREIAHTPIIPGLAITVARHRRDSVFHLHAGQAFVPETVAVVCRLLRRPYVTHVHLLVRASGRLGRLLPLYHRVVLGRVLRGSAAVVCLTEDMRDHVVQRFSVPISRTTVIPNGVDDESFVAGDRAPQPGRVLFVGRLAAQKNLGVAIRAVADLAGTELIVIGDGEERGALERLASEVGAGNVTFLGRRTAAEVRAAMSHASILVLPSTHEGMPLVVLEAAAAGLPVVASDLPELRATGLDGRFVTPHDHAAWMVALRDLLDDPEELARLSAAGVRWAEDRRWGRLVTRWSDLYADVLGGRR